MHTTPERDHPTAPRPDDNRPDDNRVGRHRKTTLLVGGLMVLGLLAGCGSDEADPEEAFCAAGDSLTANVEGLADIDILAEGTSAVEEQFSDISSDINNLRESGSEVAEQEIDALEAAVSQLGSRLDALSDDFTTSDALAVGDDVAAVVDAASTLFDKLTTTCG